jgi:hypothetical protein
VPACPVTDVPEQKRGAFAPPFRYPTFELPAEVGEGANSAVAAALIFTGHGGGVFAVSDIFSLSERQMARISPLFPLSHGVPRVMMDV